MKSESHCSEIPVPMPIIAASIVLYNTPEWQLTRLFESIRKSTIRPLLYLVDNSPQPTKVPSLHGLDATVIWSEQNNGYGAGHNLALRRVLHDVDLHFVMNPDIYFEETELEKMVRFMDSDPTIGHLMPRVIYPDGSLQYLCKLLPSPPDLLLRRFPLGPLARLMQKRTERFELRHFGYDRVLDVPYLSGCFMLFRTSALRHIGLFDERFFMYPEDIDITRRIHAHYRTIFYPGATVTHDHARESYKSVRALWIHMFNLARYFNKWGWFLDSERVRINRRTLKQLDDTQ